MEGTPKAIEMKGIVRNATKIGVQDGQAEDLINLRFMDGSWRASGNGRQIVNMPTGTIYQQLYVHTNIYHHLLGVDNGTLYWFAEIDNDGVTFYPLDGTSDRSQWPEDKQDLPTERVALTTVTGDVWITQTGHLLTVIDGADDFEHFVFKTGTNQYVGINLDVNGKETDRTLYPFCQVHFNLINNPTDYEHTVKDDDQYVLINDGDINQQDSPACVPKSDESTTHAAAQIWHAQMLKAFNEATEQNHFTNPFLAICAVKLYDGSYVYTSNPVMLFPRELPSSRTDIAYMHNAVALGYNLSGVFGGINDDADWHENLEILKKSYDNEPVYTSGASSATPNSTRNVMSSRVRGSQLTISIKDISILQQNVDLFTHVAIFITNPSPYIDMSADSYKKRGAGVRMNTSTTEAGSVYSNVSYFPPYRTNSEIIYDLTHSPFYLLKEYSINELEELQTNPSVNLSGIEYKGILQNITQQKRLDFEATSRRTYLPKVSYMYNGRLHIANYKTYPFFGYPIFSFAWHNHSVNISEGSVLLLELQNLIAHDDAYLQHQTYDFSFSSWESLNIDGDGAPICFLKVYVETQHGMQVVSRRVNIEEEELSVYIDRMNPFITYPDKRAKKLELYYVNLIIGGVQACRRTFTLKAHPYLDVAYYFNELTPIGIGQSAEILGYFRDMYDNLVDDWDEPDPPVEITIAEWKEFAKHEYVEEYFPNGLKVSKTDQPMFFPVENTYQVGSAEILALMSNTIAVGTGQTGDAPLYVFCKDGVYALYVDSSGQMAYPNARILARDVCNNPRSVTPIDAGVVFTTDRGLMMIAGEQVQEIGAPAEGDVVQFWNAGSVDYSKIATASMRQIAGLPSALCSTTDFLTYLQDKGTSGKAAIINYNHNMRELMVSNPNYPYSYVLDSEGNWSRRDYTAAQYVNNYPTSYRVDKYGHFYKVDDEGDANTTLEHRKEADNKIFYLSNVIKLDSIGFKQAYRFVVRGYFEGIPCAKGTINGVDVYIYDKGAQLIKNTNFGNIIRLQYRLSFGVVRWVNADSGFPAMIRIINQFTGEDITDTIVSADAEVIYNVTRSTTPIACVVEGSYDGRKFKPLGYNRKSGKFRDIGCIVERTDVRFFRICLSGQVTGKTRIDYMEMSAGASMLNSKIR